MSEEEAPAPGEALEFPLDCHVRVIAEAVEDMAGRIEQTLHTHGFQLEVASGNRSAGGKYVSYPLSLRMDSLEQMQAVDRSLRMLQGVKMVL